MDGAVMPDPVESSTHMLIHQILNKKKGLIYM